MGGMLAKASLPAAACLAILTAGFSADAQRPVDPRCTRLCVALIQAVGDEVKEQISLDCIQETRVCTGSGHFHTGDEQVPITVEGSVDGGTLALRIRSKDTVFAPADAQALTMPLESGSTQQVAQFVVYNRVEGTPFARSGTPLAVTVMVQRLSDQ